MNQNKADAVNRENIETQSIKEDNLTKTNTVTADSAEADNVKKAAAVNGKFKDVQTLLKAYSALEAEFTRRSQRLKELESGNKALPPPDGADGAPSRFSDEQLIESALNNQKVRDAVIGEYLKSVSAVKGVPLTSGGGGIAAPRNLPKTVREAGRLAREFMNK